MPAKNPATMFKPEGGDHPYSYRDPPRQLERVREADGEAKKVGELPPRTGPEAGFTFARLSVEYAM